MIPIANLILLKMQMNAITDNPIQTTSIMKMISKALALSAEFVDPAVVYNESLNISEIVYF